MEHVYEIDDHHGDWVAYVVCDLPEGCIDPYSEEAFSHAVVESGHSERDGFVAYYYGVLAGSGTAGGYIEATCKVDLIETLDTTLKALRNYPGPIDTVRYNESLDCITLSNSDDQR